VRVTTVFNRVLGLPSTSVTDVKIEAETVIVSVRQRRRRHLCPCGTSSSAVYDRRVRRWRHLDLAGCRLMLEATIARIACRQCGRVRTEQVPWARAGARHTTAFENQVLWCARRMDKSAVADLFRIAWETVDTMIARAAGDPSTLTRIEGLRRIGVDEISYKHGHRYLSVVVDHDSGDVVWAAEGKQAATLDGFYAALGPQRCAQLEAVTMDLGQAYRSATQHAAPQARICGDTFHLFKLLGETIEAVRRRTLHHIKDPQTRWALLKHPTRLTAHQQGLLDQLAASDTDAWRAWSLRERFREVMRSAPQHASVVLDQWLDDATNSPVAPMRNLARRFRQHRQLILNTIQLGLTNARLEGTNSKIRLINHRGYGHHRPEALIALIKLACTSEHAA
jgi:transposase